MSYNADIMMQNQFHDECVYVNFSRDLKPCPIYVGDVMHTPDEIIRMHTHGHYEISLFLAGEAEVIIGQKKYTARPGDIIITKPGDIHQFSSNQKDGMGFFYFGIEKIIPEDLAFIYMKNRHRQFSDCWDIEPLFAEMFQEVKNPSYGVQHVVSALMTRILYLLGRRMAPNVKDRQAFCDVVGAARTYVDAHMRHGISTKEIAQHCCLSESRLSHVFTEKTGITLSGYINHVLMHAAIRMLEDTSNSITGIASQLGYPSPQYFSRVFKKFWGYSPRECRSSLHKIHGHYNLRNV